MSTEEQLDPSTFKRYEGNCHCGRFKFAITRPPIEKLHDCQCSICYMNGLRGLVWQSWEGKRKFEVLRGNEDSDLISYNFANNTVTHKFCKECGTHVFARMQTPNSIGINAKALSDAALIQSIPTFMVEDGAHTREPQYKPSRGEEVKWTGEELGEGEVEYQGHCHCGSVRFVMHWKPMEEWEGKSCNCSFCWKRGGSHIYPPKSKVQFQLDPSAVNSYSYTNKDGLIASFIFCNTCGTHIACDVKKGHSGHEVPNMPYVLNIRTIEGLDLKKLYELEEKGIIEKYDARDKDPQYQGGWHEEEEKGLQSQRKDQELKGTGTGWAGGSHKL